MIARALNAAGLVLLVGMLNLPAPAAWAGTASPPQLNISQTPLSVTLPVHPQVLFAIGNSESMDGDLSGAIMTGSGGLTASAASALASSSSPVDYTISGFDPTQLNLGDNASGCALPAPATSTDSSGSQISTYPYTYTCSSNGVQYDVSGSRLNVAKEAIGAIMAKYFPSTDFGLMDYDENSPTLYKTWVYYMSDPSTGFTFSDTDTDPPSGDRYIANPCYNYTSNKTSPIHHDCKKIANNGNWSGVGDQYMLIGSSSDDPDINDVLYSNSGDDIYIDYGTPLTDENGDSANYGNAITSPFPPNFTLTEYENGWIDVGYPDVVPNGNGTVTGPTNAGYVPFSPQVMYAQRGFGYDTSDATSGGGGQIVATDSNGNAIISAGQNPTQDSVDTAMGYFTSALDAETNDPNSSEIKALAVQSPLAGLLQSALSTLQNATPPSYDCTKPKQYVVLVTDGLPTEDLNGKFWPPLGSAAGAGYGVTAKFNTATGALEIGSDTNDQALIDTINEITALKNAGIETYVIGLGAGVDPSNNPEAADALKAMAVAGGTSGVSSSGYFPATSSAALSQDLASILSNIASQNTSSSSTAANSTALTTNSYLYQATFNPGSDTDDAWTGDLKEYAVDTNANISTRATWSAQAQLDQQGAANRNIVTWDPDHVPSDSTTAVPTAVPFEWNNLSATLQGELAQGTCANEAQECLEYLRGDHSNEEDVVNKDGNYGIFRTREHLLGDIVDSSPVYVGAPSGYYPDASYKTFVTTYANRTPMLYVGANDGMLHGFNATNGDEEMAFIPNGVFDNLYMLASPYYLYNHHFFVDGTPTVGDALLSDGQWHTLLVGGENAGGKSIYAIDVTNPASYTSEDSVASDVKWEFTDADMGYSYSAPVIVRSNAVTVTDASDKTNVDGFAVLFGNGYNSPSEQPYFYAVDASTGTILAKIDLCTAPGVPADACSSSAPDGLSSITAANSSGVVGAPQDMAYAGDLQGNLWAIDMSNLNPKDWTVRLLFQARVGSGKNQYDQPITTAPTVTLNPHFPGSNGQSYLGLMVYFGTGMFLQNSDLTDTNTQSYYGVWDNTADLSNYPSSSMPSPPYTRADLQEQTISTGTYTSPSGVTTPAILSSNNAVNLTYAFETVSNPSPPPHTLAVPPVEGWYFDLSPLTSSDQPTARVFTNSVIKSGGVGFTINIPPASTATTCGIPSSYYMNVAYATGGPFSQASIGFGGGVSIDSSATVSGQNPTGELISNGYSSGPTTLRNRNGNSNFFSGNTLSTIPSLGDQSGRLGWWQVQ